MIEETRVHKAETTNPPFWSTIKFKLILLAGIMSLVPLIVLGGYNLLAAKKNLTEAVSYRHTEEVYQVVRDLEGVLMESKRALSVMAAAEGVRFPNLSQKEQEQLLSACLVNLPYVERIYAIDQQGEEFAQVSRLDVTIDKGRNRPDKELIRKINNYEVYIGSVTMDQNNKPILVLGIPFLIDPIKGSRGGIIAEIGLRNVVDRISFISKSKDKYIFLVDSKGQLVGHEDFSQVLRHVDIRESLPSAEDIKVREGNDSPLVTTYRSYTGEMVVGAYEPVKDTDLAVILEQSERKAYKSYYDLKKTFIMSSILLGTFFLLIGLGFGMNLGKRLETLKDGVRRIASGETGFTLPVHNNDELGEVLKAFNSLSEELKNKQDMEVAVRQADKMVSVGLLASGVAHEINNPLASIYLSVEELLERLNDQKDKQSIIHDDLQRYLSTIAEQVERCSKITRDLLDFAREKEKETIDAYDIHDIIEKIETLTVYRFRKSGIQFVKAFDQDIPQLWGDGPSIQQVIFNLVCNAVGAMENGGCLEIRTCKINDRVKIQVIDTGVGIPQEHMERIYEPFFTTKPVGKGTGLGLAVCYGLMEKMGGRIQVESTLGKGTIVTLLLPLYNDLEKECRDDER